MHMVAYMVHMVAYMDMDMDMAWRLASWTCATLYCQSADERDVSICILLLGLASIYKIVDTYFISNLVAHGRADLQLYYSCSYLVVQLCSVNEDCTAVQS